MFDGQGGGRWRWGGMPGLRKVEFTVRGSMPTVGTRKSTKVFVPKAAVTAAATEEEQVPVLLRSGKRLHFSKPPGKKVEAGERGDEWVPLFGVGKTTGCGLEDGIIDRKVPVSGNGCGDSQVVVCNGVGMKFHDDRFGHIYCRKRKRLPADENGTSCSTFGVKEDSLRYGVVYVRRKKRNCKSGKRSTLKEEGELVECEGSVESYEVAQSARSFAAKLGIFENNLWNGRNNSVSLIILVDHLAKDSVDCFGRLFSLILDGVRRKRLRLGNLASFLLSKAIQGVFSQHGVHFLLGLFDFHDCFGNARTCVGICRISDSSLFTPHLSVNFSALPSYFMSLHMAMFLGSGFMNISLLHRHLQISCQSNLRIVPSNVANETNERIIFPENGNSPGPSLQNVSSVVADIFTKVPISNSPPVMVVEGNRDGFNHCGKNIITGEVRRVKNPRLLASRSITSRRSMVTRSQKKRTSLRSARHRSHNLNRSFPLIYSSRQKVKPPARMNSLSQIMDMEESADHGSCVSPFTLPNEMVKKNSQISSDDRMKELKTTAAEIKHKIDSISCKASILVIEPDMCWREENAEVMLGSSSSGDWCLLVKVNGVIRYTHKPHEVRSSIPNRYTHSLIWIGDGTWKLEFANKMDWAIFKQLQRECLERNTPESSATSIPVPGVMLVPEYESECQVTFLRPDSYIKTKCSEIERILAGEATPYDMDSGDEEWLKTFNSTVSNESSATKLLEDTFERIIYLFEKAIYNRPDAINQDVAAGLCLDLTNKETSVAVYNYWQKKKKQKRAALVRIFQMYPIQRMRPPPGAFLRKKRSFKRQGSSMGRGKPAFYLQAGAKQEELRKVREAEAAASKSAETAIKMRSRVQTLMQNADLLTYKSVMAVRMAETVQNSVSVQNSELVDVSPFFDF